jgi:hypothetical protein
MLDISARFCLEIIRSFQYQDRYRGHRVLLHPSLL